MPVVDLSNIGLEGQQAFASRMATLAQADVMKANARQQQLENEDTERMNQLNDEASAKLVSLARGDRTSPSADVQGIAERMDSLAAPMEVIADVYARGGAPGKATEILKAASQVRKQEADIEDGKVLREQRKLENIIKGADVVSRYLGTARNQSEYDFGIEQLRKQGVMEPEFIDQLAGMGWSQDLSAFLNEKAVSAAEQARLEMQQQNLDRTEAYRAAQLSRADRASRIAEARHRENVRHNKAVEKAGGKNSPSASAPSARDLTSAKTALKSTVFRDVEGGDIDAAAEYVASQARALVRQNTALTWDQAVQQTIIRGQQNGAFTVDEESTGGLAGLFGATKSKAKFDGQGLSAETAVPMPKSKNEMKKGRYYITARGRALWNGNGFELAE